MVCQCLGVFETGGRTYFALLVDTLVIQTKLALVRRDHSTMIHYDIIEENEPLKCTKHNRRNLTCILLAP